jgi:DNA repair protein RadA/Sms
MGKSTLLLQVAHAMAGQGKVAYLSGEESPEQVLLRARRLGIRGGGIFLLTDPCIDSLWQHLDALTPSLLIVDSIQTVYTEGVEGTPGSILQVRECARLLLQWGKAHRTPVVLVGHVTKEGEVAGPQVLQHMVDAVLLLEGERNTPLRILRAVKNRFGPTDEVAVLEMGPQGLREVPDPSRYLLSGRAPAPGSVVAPLLVGDRPLLVEVQALTGPAGNFAPRRDAVGYDERRLRSVAAALAQRARFPVGDKDIAVKVVGGIRADDPAADLAVALAIASSVRDVPLEPGAVAFGEVGLTGELRPVPHTRRRLQETARLGFTAVILPLREEEPIPPGLTVYPVGTLRQALEKALPQRG